MKKMAEFIAAHPRVAGAYVRDDGSYGWLFQPGTEPADVQAVLEDAKDYDFTDPPPPDIDGAMLAVLNDANLPQSLRAQLISYGWLIPRYLQDPDGVRGAWALLKANLIPADCAAIVEAHCTAHYIALA